MGRNEESFEGTAWIEQVRARGLADAFRVALDVLEPLGPLGANLVWTAQPILSRWLPREAIGALAELLDTPGGIDHLRRQLDDDPR
ncbi:MAG: hypothetical protein JNM70_23835 [Anaerolineae bacterium]|nr:hypothetical protein [Anaerolineae bacterium]